MTTPTAGLAQLTHKAMDGLHTDPDDLMYIRILYEDFIDKFDQFAASEKDLPFFLLWTYKNYAADILRSSVEDDILESERLTERLTALTELLRSSWSKALAIPSNGNSDHAWATWGKETVRFADAFRQLLVLRRSRSYAVIGGLKFLVPPPGSELRGLPTPRTKQREPDPTLRIFPDLDATLTDPVTSRRVRGWYAKTIHEQIQQRARCHGQQIDSLCFVEKSYSVVGALSLVSQLVGDLGLPASIYRRAYPNGESRITGTSPQPGGLTILVYDVAASGEVLESAATFLREHYQVKAVAALVSYDFGLGAHRRLAEEEVELIPFLERRNLDRQQAAAALKRRSTRSQKSSASASGAARKEVNAMSSKERGAYPPPKPGAILDALMEKYRPVIEQAEQDLHGSGLDRDALDPAAPVQFAATVRQTMIEKYRPVIEQAEQDLHGDIFSATNAPLDTLSDISESS